MIHIARNRSLSIASFLVAVLASLWAICPAAAETPNRVALVVQNGDTVITRCIEFDEAEISGYDVLDRSGLDITASYNALGAAICAIEGTGCPEETCLKCKAPEYWSYWHYVDGDWRYSQKGASNYDVGDGDMEGWVWGQGSPPSAFAYENICEPLSPTATPEPPTATPEPPTATPEPPTATPEPPTATPEPPTATDEPTATPETPTEEPTATTTPDSGDDAAPEGSLWLDASSVDADECTTMHWRSSNAHSVYLNGDRVILNGSRRVCATTDTEFDLRVVGDGGETQYAVMLSVLAPAEPPAPADSPTPAISAPQAGETPTESLAPLPTTPSPSATATPSAEPLALQVGSPTPAHLAAAQATIAPSPSPAANTESTASSAVAHSRLPTGSILFGAVVAFLLVKFVQLRRRW